MKRPATLSMADSWGLMAACSILCLFCSFAAWTLRKDLISLKDDPPLKAATLEVYLLRSPPSEADRPVIAKLVRDYALMDSRYESVSKAMVAFLFSAAIATGAGALLSVLTILSRIWQAPQEDDSLATRNRSRTSFLLGEKVKAVKELGRPRRSTEQPGPK